MDSWSASTRAKLDLSPLLGLGRVSLGAVTLAFAAASVGCASDSPSGRFDTVAEQAAEMSTATTVVPTTTTVMPTTTTVPPTTAGPTTTTTTTTAPAPPPATVPPTTTTTIDLTQADEYGCSHANGCLPYGGDGQSSGESQFEYGCEQGYITEGC